MRRLMVGLVTVLALTVVIGGAREISFAQPAAPGTYYKTYAGFDFKPLETDDVVRLAPNTGGGVWMKAHTNPNTDLYMETRLDLPNGARVTEVRFYVRACDTQNPPFVYFAAYRPSLSDAVFILPYSLSPTGACDATLTYTQPVTGADPIDNSQFTYSLGYLPPTGYDIDEYEPSIVKTILVGARVTYQAAGAFLPAVQR